MWPSYNTYQFFPIQWKKGGWLWTVKQTYRCKGNDHQCSTVLAVHLKRLNKINSSQPLKVLDRKKRIVLNKHKSKCSHRYIRLTDQRPLLPYTMLTYQNSFRKSNALLKGNTKVQKQDDSDEERELTNLNWLLRNQNLTWPKTIDTITEDDINTNANSKVMSQGIHFRTQNLSEEQIKQSYEESSVNKKPVSKSKILSQYKMLPSSPLPKRPTPAERYEIFINKIKRDLSEYEKLASKYETDVTEKPPFNYSHIIGMAMLVNGRVTLQQICAWIESKFAFFRVRKRWNNSIRHNLSLHHCFRNRKREEKGKGGYWELGVDPKKCDRKRIRNRKLSHKKLNQTPKRSWAHWNTTNPNIQNVSGEYNQLAPIQHVESIQNSYRRSSKMPQTNALVEMKGPKNHGSSSFTLTELGLSLSTGVSSQVNDIFTTSFRSNMGPMTTIADEEIYQQQYELGTIIISTTEIIDESNGLNCLITDKLGCTSMIYKEDDIAPFNESVNITSNMTPVLASTSANLNVLEEQDGTLITSAISSPVHPSSITINYDYTNFRPLMDSIDEPFHYLHSTAEFGRSDDILDNLLDVCVTHY
ncbi:forkhead box protein O isoform X1 [Drosophila miranda]|uniref:forkhead box protein O isoform X1 n=2 Tax=Drosophila miranda TaxID=7229 RepID=UPI0007E5E3B8|nr:forkhead box protein O isoform X1 [Drosophila miranda]